MAKHERSTFIPDKRHLSGMRDRPLDQRKNSDGDSDAVLLRRKHCFSDSYEMNDLPASHYQRGYET